MTLFRFIYLRDKAERCITWPASSYQEAEKAAKAWVAHNQKFWKDCQLLAILPFQRGLAERESALYHHQISLPFSQS